jgi:hypothetical protein
MMSRKEVVMVHHHHHPLLLQRIALVSLLAGRRP